MKIEDASKSKLVTVGFIPTSECFVWEDQLWIKAKPRSNERTNAVCLESGECWYFSADCHVLPAKAKVVIE